MAIVHWWKEFVPGWGELGAARSNDGICAVALSPGSSWPRKLPGNMTLIESRPELRCFFREVREFFAHKRTTFTTPIDLTAVSPFTRRVLARTARIPYGKTQSYGAVSSAIGKPGSARAVGGALGRNPVPLLVPCHRVTAANGLGGFSGGTELKRRLLALEQDQGKRGR